jgi:hypothetical protein
MKSFHLLMAAALLSVSGAALAEDQASAGEPKKEKKICKTERVTGSLTRVSRTCMTQADWDRLREGTRNELDRLDKNQNHYQREAPAGILTPVG